MDALGRRPLIDDGRVLECGVHGHLAVKRGPHSSGHFHVQRDKESDFRFEDGRASSTLDAGFADRVTVNRKNR